MGYELFEYACNWISGKKELAKTRLDTRIKLAKARAEARAALYKSGKVGDIAWSTDDLNISYLRNNLLTGLISLPLLMAWFPETSDWVQHGFELLEHMPIWYQTVAGTCFISAFGVDKFKDLMSFRSGAKHEPLCPSKTSV